MSDEEAREKQRLYRKILSIMADIDAWAAREGEKANPDLLKLMRVLQRLERAKKFAQEESASNVTPLKPRDPA